MRRNAFTLIELLVVIAIIAILAAILFPVFAQAREKARQISCASNEKQLGLATLQYIQDYDETFPEGNTLWGNGPWGAYRANWAGEIVPYIKSTGVFACPDDSGAGQLTKGVEWQGLAMSYAPNGLHLVWAPTPGRQCLGVMCMAGIDPPQALARVVEPSSVVMYAEVFNSDLTKAGMGGNHASWWQNVITGVPWWFGLGVPNQCDVANQGAGQGDGVCRAYPNGINGAVSAHHNGMSNFTFTDGHVKAMNPTATVPCGPTGAGCVASGNWWNWGEYSQTSMWNAQHTQ